MRKLSERVGRDGDREARERLDREELAQRRVQRALSGPARLSVRRNGSQLHLRIRPAPVRAVMDLVVERGENATMEMIVLAPTLVAVGTAFSFIVFQFSILPTVIVALSALGVLIALFAAFGEAYAGYALTLEDGWVYVRGRGQQGFIAPLKTLDVGRPDAESGRAHGYIAYKPVGIRRQSFWVRLNRTDIEQLTRVVGDELGRAPEIRVDEHERAKPQRTWLDSALWLLMIGSVAAGLGFYYFG